MVLIPGSVLPVPIGGRAVGNATPSCVPSAKHRLARQNRQNPRLRICASVSLAARSLVVVDGYLHPTLREFQGNASTNAAGASGDQCAVPSNRHISLLERGLHIGGPR